MTQTKFSQHLQSIGGEGKRKEIAAQFGVPVENVSFARTEMTEADKLGKAEQESSIYVKSTPKANVERFKGIQV